MKGHVLDSCDLSPSILSAYLEVLKDLNDQALSWAYGSMSEIPKEKIKAVLQSEGMKGSNMNMHSFLTALNLV